jgi:hypothetical protein
MIIPYRPKTIVTVLLAVVILAAFSYFFFIQIDNIVNVDLYNYGLTFSNGWADKYLFNARIFAYSSISSVMLFSGSIACFLGYNKSRKSLLSSACSWFLVIGSASSILSIYFFYKLDFIVNYDLYFYGLQLDSAWYVNYSLYALLSVSLIVINTIAGFVLAIFVGLSTRKSIEIIPEKLMYSTLIAVGTLSLVLSIVYVSSFLALIGLGLIFWGLTLTYIRTEEYVKKILLDKSTSSQIATVNKVISAASMTGNAMFLPPTYFKVPDVYKAYISKDINARPPTPELMNKQEPQFFTESLQNPPALLLTPPGAELARFFEKELKTNFQEVNLPYLQVNLPKLLVDDLEIVKYFNMDINNNIIRVRMDGSVYKDIRTDNQQVGACFSFGSPLTSAIACVLAKATGNPIVMGKRQTSPDGEDIIIEYHILNKMR